MPRVPFTQQRAVQSGTSTRSGAGAASQMTVEEKSAAATRESQGVMKGALVKVSSNVRTFERGTTSELRTRFLLTGPNIGETVEIPFVLPTNLGRMCRSSGPTEEDQGRRSHRPRRYRHPVELDVQVHQGVQRERGRCVSSERSNVQND